MKLRIPSISISELPLTERKTINTWLAILLFFLFLVTCMLAFFCIVQPELNHESTLRLGADSDTYFRLADSVKNGSGEVALIGLGTNLLGPILVALFFKTGIFIALFNLALFCISIFLAAKSKDVNPWMVSTLLMINAETLVSITTLNKEIFALLSVSLLAKYVYSERKSVLTIFFLLLCALLARWEEFLITLILIFIIRRKSYFSNKPWLALSLLVFALTISYPFVVSHVDVSGFTSQAENGGLVTVLNTLQSHFLYPIALVPKILMGLFGRILTPSYFFGEYWNQDFTDLQNQFAGHGHTFAMLAICILAVFKRCLSLKDPLILFSSLYLVLASINPFVQTRYSYPVYVALSFVLAKRHRTNEISLVNPKRKIYFSWFTRSDQYMQTSTPDLLS